MEGLSHSTKLGINSRGTNNTATVKPYTGCYSTCKHTAREKSEVSKESGSQDHWEQPKISQRSRRMSLKLRPELKNLFQILNQDTSFNGSDKDPSTWNRIQE